MTWKRAMLALAIVILAATPSQAQDAGGRCAGMKLKAVAKTVSGLLNCRVRAARRGDPVEQKCVDRVETHFEHRIRAAERRGGCDGLGNGEALRAAIHAFMGR